MYLADETHLRKLLSPVGDLVNPPRNEAPSSTRGRGLLCLCSQHTLWPVRVWCLVPLSFLSLQVTGSVRPRCHVHRPFPATPRSRAKRLSSPCRARAAMGSATAPASFSDTPRATADQRHSLSRPAGRVTAPCASGKTTCTGS